MATSVLTKFFPFLSPSNPPPPKSQLPFSFPSSLTLIHQKTSPSNDKKFATLSVGGGQEANLEATLYPTLAYSNALFFRSSYNVQVMVDENEPEEKLLNRFRREVMKAGVIQECKRRRFFENKQDEMKRKSRDAAKRNKRRRPQSRSSFQNRPEASSFKKDKEDDEDNWELPEGDLPLLK